MERISVQAFLLQPTRVECGGGLLTGTAQYTYDSGVMMYIYGIVSAVVLVIVSLATQSKKTAA